MAATKDLRGLVQDRHDTISHLSQVEWDLFNALMQPDEDVRRRFVKVDYAGLERVILGLGKQRRE